MLGMILQMPDLAATQARACKCRCVRPHEYDAVPRAGVTYSWRERSNNLCGTMPHLLLLRDPRTVSPEKEPG